MQRSTGATFIDGLTGDQPVAGAHRVAQPDLDRGRARTRRELVHLRLVGEARLHDAEPAHRPARQVVRAHGVAVDDGVGAPVRALGVGHGVDQHRRRRRGVGAAVEHHPGLDLDDLAVGGGVVTHPDRGRMAVDVAEEALGAAVGHPHGTPEAQGEQAGVHLQADVLAGPERPADAAEHEADRLDREVEACGDLGAVLVQPLRGDVQFDALAARVGDRQRCLETEERLVLHPDLVGALDDDVAGGVDVARRRSAGDGSRCRRGGSADGSRRSPPRGRAAARAPRTARRSPASARRQVSG
jgi:hypothetical protein